MFPKTMNPDGTVPWVSTLTGVPVVTLLSAGVPAQVSYARFGTGKAVEAGLPAHGAANFRTASPACVRSQAGAAVPLTGSPVAGYDISAYCARTPSTPGYQFARPYSLDTGPRPVIPAHGAVRFAMQLAIRTLTCPTARLAIGWVGGPSGFTLGGPQTSFTVAVRG